MELCRRGDRLVGQVAKDGDFLTTFWACALGGYLPCPFPSGELSGICAVLGTSQVVTDMGELRAAAIQEPPHVAELTDPALLMPMPNGRVAVLTHANVLASIAAKAKALDLTGTDVTLNWAPFNHGSALVENHLLSLWLGANQVHAAAFPSDPMRLLRLIDRTASA